MQVASSDADPADGSEHEGADLVPGRLEDRRIKLAASSDRLTPSRSNARAVTADGAWNRRSDEPLNNADLVPLQRLGACHQTGRHGRWVGDVQLAATVA